MIKYTVKRLLFFIPSVFFISVICFLLVRSAPGGLVDFMIRSQTEEMSRTTDARAAYTIKYREKAEELGTDLPSFFIELTTLSTPRHLSYEWNPLRKKIIAHLIDETGNAQNAEAYYSSVEKLDSNLYAFEKSFSDRQNVIDAKRASDMLLHAEDRMEIEESLAVLKSVLEIDSAGKAISADWVLTCENSLSNLNTNNTTWKNYVPVIRLHSRSAYGRWLLGDGKKNRGVIRGDFGTSLIDKKNVNDSLMERVGLTVLLSVISVLLAFLISVPLGIISALYNNTILEKFISTFLFILYALPSFWVASLCIMWLAGGDGLDWFAPYGTGEITPDMNAGEIILLKWKHFALPIFAWTYSGIAFISKQTKAAVLESSEQLYTQSAIARGLPFKRILWKHIMPNSLRPLITMLANILPGLIGGSVVLETIFSLPGLGEWAYRAFLYRDIPVIMAVLFWGSILTLAGYLLSDILLALADPKIRYSSSEKK